MVTSSPSITRLSKLRELANMSSPRIARPRGSSRYLNDLLLKRCILKQYFINGCYCFNIGHQFTQFWKNCWNNAKFSFIFSDLRKDGESWWKSVGSHWYRDKIQRQHRFSQNWLVILANKSHWTLKYNHPMIMWISLKIPNSLNHTIA